MLQGLLSCALDAFDNHVYHNNFAMGPQGVNVCMLHLQDGYFLVLQQDEAIMHNITGTSPGTGYTVWAGADMPYEYDFSLVNGTCSSNSTAPYITEVNACSNYERCCINTTAYTVSALLLGCSKSAHATVATKTRTYRPAISVHVAFSCNQLSMQTCLASACSGDPAL